MNVKPRKEVFPYILDNGAHALKFGNSADKDPHLIPNCIMKVKSEKRRLFIGDQIEECRDTSGLFYILPFQKGYLVNWDVQKTVWDHVFSKELNYGKLTDVPLCITEPVMNFQSVQEAMDEIFFEEYELCGLLRLTPVDLSAYYYSCCNGGLNTCIVVDTGYSFTHVVPFINGKKYLPGAKRLDVGGKVLTNHLKEMISYRQLNVMDETYVINQMKEDSCFLSKNFLEDMKTTVLKNGRNTIVQEYVLPDYNKIRRGYLQPPSYLNVIQNTDSTTTSADQPAVNSEQQTVMLNNERFTIPEILFHPSDIGISQKGIAEIVVDCVKSCPPDAKYQLLANIVVTGGNANFKNFQDRMYGDIRKSFDENYHLNVSVPASPEMYPWKGGRQLAKTDKFYQCLISKAEYEEYGTTLSNARFQNFDITY